jgi:hypothetical protein
MPNPKMTECKMAHSGIRPGNMAVVASAEADGAAAPKKKVTSAR